MASGLVVHHDELFRRIDDSPIFRPLGLSGAIGIARAHPEFLPSEHLTPSGRAVAAAIRDGCDGCDGRQADGSPAPEGTWAEDHTTVHPFESDIGRMVLDRIWLPRPDVVPSTPTWLDHGLHDELVDVGTLDALAAAWCDAGTPLLLDRLPTNHYGSAGLGGPTALAHLRSVFDGQPFVAPPSLTHPCHQR